MVVHSKPPSLTSGAANWTSSAISLLTLHRFFFFPTLKLGGSRKPISHPFCKVSRATQNSHHKYNHDAHQNLHHLLLVEAGLGQAISYSNQD